MTTRVDLCVIGGGSGGLSVAAGAAQLGASVVLFEGHRMGGDCLNTGCVPSKTLLAAAKAAARDGVAGPGHYARAKATVREVIASIAPHDSVERFEGLGVRVIQHLARFEDAKTVVGGDSRVRARRIVIATGSRPRIPPISGLETVPYWTSETLFSDEHLPTSLIVLGGGPIGLEMAQAHQLFGCQVTVVEPDVLMPRDEPSLVAELREILEASGIRVLVGASVRDVARAADGQTTVRLSDGQTLTASRLLLATGRVPNVETLDLPRAGVAATSRGVTTDSRLRTSQRHIFAIGDVAGREAFTHAASAHASVVVKQALFGLPAKVGRQTVPWVTYTDPELAHAGLTVEQRDAVVPRSGQRVVEIPFSDIDRARCEGRTDGRIRIVTDHRGRLLSVDILGQHAGELILPWVLALDRGLRLSQIASTIVPYPTRSEVTKRVASAFFTPRLFSDRTRAVVRWVQRWIP
ncbi:MAG: dihydrolipoamide dehydrogenase [Gammaproteobacteria bacterium]|nr:dihydrolipoamide dehydrogenase [Gammaproteobacteria bacterium]